MNNVIFLWRKKSIITSYFRLPIGLLFAFCLIIPNPSLSHAQSYRSELLSVQDSLKLITYAQPRIAKRHRISWANSLVWGMEQHSIKRNKENVCAMIAIIDQESNFRANPTVAGLGKKVIKTVHAKLDNIPFIGSYGKKFLKSYPNKRRSYHQMLRRAKTERDLDWTYRKLLHNSLGSMRDFSILTSLLENTNEIDTIGSMQVSVDFAIKQEEKYHGRALNLKEIEILRDWMYTKRGGIFYGAKLLLNYRTDYKRKIFRFADYNAGRYASRNAAFQYMMNLILHGHLLVLDGDLLRYNTHGKPLWNLSNSEKSLHKIIKKYRLSELNSLRIRADLLKEKRYAFVHTKTYKAIGRLYQKLKRRPILRAKMPEIKLKSEKFTSRFSTKRFARKVNSRYQRCISYAKTRIFKSPHIRINYVKFRHRLFKNVRPQRKGNKRPRIYRKRRTAKANRKSFQR